MLQRLKLSSRGQILFLLISIPLIWSLKLLLEFEPRLRFSLENLAWGTAGGLGGLALVLAFRFFNSIPVHSNRSPENHSANIVRYVLLGACCEEVILRGYLFNWLVANHPTLSWLIHAGLVFILYFRLWSGWQLALLQALFGTLSAALFLSTKSLFCCALASVIFNLALVMLPLASERIKGYFRSIRFSRLSKRIFDSRVKKRRMVV